MRVLFLTESPVVWGAEKSLIDLALSLVDAGVAVTIVCSDRSPLHGVLNGTGVETVPAPFDSVKRPGRVGRMWGKWMANIRLVAHLRQHLADHDFAVAYNVWYLPSLVVAAKLTGRPLWLDLHETFGGRLLSLGLSVFAPFLDGVIAPSRVMLRRAGRAQKMGHVVARGLSVDSLSRAERLNRGRQVKLPLRVGIVGQISPHKGHELVIDACNGFASEDLTLHIVGIDPGDEITDVARALGVRQSSLEGVKLVHRVSDIFPTLADLDVVVNASLHEAFGRTMLEAAAVGAMPVALGDQGPREIVELLGVGAVLPRSSDALADLLRELLVDRGALDEVRAVGPQRVRAKFALPVIARRYLNVMASRKSG